MTLRGLAIAAALAAAACTGEQPLGQSGAGEGAAPATAAPAKAPAPAPSAAPPRREALGERVAAVDAAVGRWRTAGDLAAARRAAEEARNLIVGPAGPMYGDANRDGVIAGRSATGLLPGARGEPGLASGSSSACVKRDLLGGDWSNPAQRWAILDRAIARWRPANNSFPSLASHSQRIIGWATLTLATDSLATARDYGRHAQIHADVSSRAVSDCRR